MKYAHIERYRVTLEILSPVFIGSAAQEKLSQKECIVDVRNGVVYIPDLSLLVDTIDQHGCMEDFEAFLQKNVVQQGQQSLYQFLQAMCIPVSAREPWVKYILRVGSREITRVNALARFIKNAEGIPYIPGSSIKGAIRTALLAENTSVENLDKVIQSVENDARDRRIMKNRRAGSEEYALRTLAMNTKKPVDEVNDLLRTLGITDCSPFKGDSLVVCKKLEFDSDGNIRGNEDGNRRGKTAPPLYRECLLPGQRTHFYLTLDTSLAGKQLTIERIRNALNQWNQIQTQYLEEFYIDDIKLDRKKNRGVPLTLGGGVGFQSKSIVCAHPNRDKARKTVEMILTAQFPRYKPKYTNDPAPYRLKIVTCDGVNYQMGRCDMLIEEG